MKAHNLCLSLLVAVFIVAPTQSEQPRAAQPRHRAPTFTDVQKRFLSRLARRTLRDGFLDRPSSPPDYVPSSLIDIEVEVIVRVRQGGRLVGAGAAGPKPISQAVQLAMALALDTWRIAGAPDLDSVNGALVEIEVIGEPTPLVIGEDWTEPRVIDPFIEPGIDGVLVGNRTLTRRLCPTELIVGDLILADALKRIARPLCATPSDVASATLMRFRTAHWFEERSGGAVRSLQRGLSLVDSDDLTPDEFDRTIERLAEYMMYRQLPTGLFSYQYEPASDRYSEKNNLVRQAGAAAALAIYADYSGKLAPRAAAEKAIRYHLQGLTSIRDMDDTGFIATASGNNKLGLTALLSMAMSSHPDRVKFAQERRALLGGMFWLQRPSGMFVTGFPPSPGISAQNYFPGEALLAMAMEYRLDPSAGILDGFHSAISFYRDYFRDTRSPAFMPWQVQAFTIMAIHGKRKDYIDFVFELADWLARKQITDACPWPELVGGIAAYQPRRAGVATAAYLEGFADALKLARFVGDRERIKRYEKVVLQAARFVIQLQFRPEEAYFVRSPKDAIGGIRTTPTLNLLRIDHCQHALIGLIKARQALFPEVD